MIVRSRRIPALRWGAMLARFDNGGWRVAVWMFVAVVEVNGGGWDDPAAVRVGRYGRMYGA